MPCPDDTLLPQSMPPGKAQRPEYLKIIVVTTTSGECLAFYTFALAEKKAYLASVDVVENSGASTAHMLQPEIPICSTPHDADNCGSMRVHAQLPMVA